VQPETALPITYRTLSIEIGEGQQQKQKEAKKIKEKAAVGKSHPSFVASMHSISVQGLHL
jgi:hypothetical protein